MGFNPDERLFDIDYKNPHNIAYLVAKLEDVWGVERINTLMNAAVKIRIQQEKENFLAP